MSNRFFLAVLSTSLLLTTQTHAQTDDEAAREMARKAQDPLGDVKAIMNENTIGFGAGDTDDTIFNLQLQPVYAIATIDFIEGGEQTYYLGAAIGYGF